MKVAFFTEAGYGGKVPKNNPNMRTDVAWVHALDADHYPINYIQTVPDNSYDLGIAILPKIKDHVRNLDVSKEMKRICKVTSIMQESNYFMWQDETITDQIWYLNTLAGIDFMFTHNNIDQQYYSGLLNKPCEKLPSVMITDFVKRSDEMLDAVIIGGNLVAAYRGIDSFMVARELELPIHAISSGRRKPNEESLGITHLPWTTWLGWMEQLSKFKYGVQFGIGGAGSFNLNCAYLGIPCIGLKELESQNLCFPDLSIGDVDLKKGKELILKLKNDQDFYNHCSKTAQENYTKHFAVDKFYTTVENIYKKYLNEN
jgi:hypothetical protein|tara:strand:+ start:6795 stop:7739 length:945 start_codon:yes stop_codon:yes gene_type:complete